MSIDRGFLTIAQNTDGVDYLRLAYAQAMSIKLTMPDSQYCVIVDKSTNEQITDEQRLVFDHIRVLDEDYAKQDEWKLANEWQVFNLSPYKETIKVESDILFTRSIEHWWHAFRLRDIVLSLGTRDFKGKQAKSRVYRKIFDANQLPDVYNGLMYFRYSKTASEFFEIAEQVFKQWETVKENILKGFSYEEASTDVVYAITAKTLGIELCTLPDCDFINFTHMKNAINDWPDDKSWTEMIMTEIDLPMIRINNVNQYHPVHYQDKNWLTDEIIERYKECLHNKN
jgi:hypothetical protein|tara:strand:+ start:6188 stop:7039 length:852 start_codon:yes stop_codon:yes gene_type:complete